MTNPVSNAYRSADDYWTDEAETYCKTAHTVTAGALCDESTVISDACRDPHNAVDAFVCDDAKMATVQGTILDGLKGAAKAILSALVGRAK